MPHYANFQCRENAFKYCKHHPIFGRTTSLASMRISIFKRIEISMTIITLLLIPPSLSAPGDTGERTPIINTRYGQVQGMYRSLDNGDKVATYLGIPYATPPINKNRLSPTRTSAQWQRVLEAVNFGPACPQNPPKEYAHLLRHQSEDCLYLNLYVPVGLKNSPVLVVIPGESYEWGSASLYDSTLLAARGRYVVVTLNYRIGILGFLNPLGDGQKRTSVVNYGLMDQIAALHWVQENIGRFGGDPSSVTVMGRGRAAACIAFLIISPANAVAKLFHRAILMSGTALSPWALVQNPSHFAQEVARQLNCDLPQRSLRHDLLHHCVRNRTVDQILSVRLQTPQFLSALGPTIDGVTITSDWRQQLAKISKEGKSPVDLLVGVAEDDVYDVFNNAEYVNGFKTDVRDKIFRTFVTNTFHYHLQELLLTITAHYTDWSHPAQHPVTTRQLTMGALQDASLVAPSVTTAIRLTASHRSTYFYVMEASQDEQLPLLEMAYVLGAPLGTRYPLAQRSNSSESDAMLSRAIIKLWSNFVKTGNPNDPSLAEQSRDAADAARYRAPIWELFDPIDRRYLELGQSRARLQNHYRSDRVALWTWLLPALEGVGARHGPESPYHRLPDFHRLETFSGPTRSRPLLPATTSTSAPSTLPPPRVSDAELNGLGLNGSMVFNRSRPYEGTEWLQAATGNQDAFPHESRNKQDLGSLSYSTTLSLTAALGISLLLLNALVLATVHCRRGSRNNKHSNDSSESAGNTMSMPSPSHCGTLRSSSTLRSIAATPFTSDCPPDYNSCPKQVAHLQGTPLHLQQLSEQTTLYNAGHISPPLQNIQPPPQELQYHANQTAPDLHYNTNDNPMQELRSFSPHQYQPQQTDDRNKPSLRLTATSQPQIQQSSPLLSTAVQC